MENRIMTTSGTSMYNLIVSNDKIVVNIGKYKIKFGDVIVYEGSHGYTAHRFYFPLFNYLVVAGDNCREFELVDKEKVFGKVEYIIKNSGYFKISDKNKIRTVYTVFLFFFIIVNNYTFDSLKINSLSGYTKWKQRVCKFIYSKRRELQCRYLDNSKIFKI